MGVGCGAWEEINNWSVDIPAKTSVDLPGPGAEEKDAQSERLRQDFNSNGPIYKASFRNIITPPRRRRGEV